MRTSEKIDLISAALVKAQAVMKDLEKSGINPFFKKPGLPNGSPYSTMDDVVSACKKSLNDNGISFHQGASFKDGLWLLVTRLQHISGQWLEADYPLVSKDNSPQGMAAGNTYARRIALQTITGLSGEPDDDGNAANNNHEDKGDKSTQSTTSTSVSPDYVFTVGRVKGKKIKDCTNQELDGLLGWINQQAKPGANLIETKNKILGWLERSRLDPNSSENQTFDDINF